MMIEVSNELKEQLIGILENLAVLRRDDNLFQQQFLAGENALDFESLNIESLASMEICIAVEMRYGVSIAPDELLDMGNVLELAEYIQSTI